MAVSSLERSVINSLIAGRVEYEPLVQQLESPLVLKTAAASEAFSKGCVSKHMTQKVLQIDPSFLDNLSAVERPMGDAWKNRGLSHLFRAGEHCYENDLEVMSEAVIRDGLAFVFASEQARNIRNIASIAVFKHPENSNHIGPALKPDRAILPTEGEKICQNPLFRSRRAMARFLLKGRAYNTLVKRIKGQSALKTAAVSAFYANGKVEGQIRTWLTDRDPSFLQKLDGLQNVPSENRLVALLGQEAFRGDKDVARFAVACQGRLLSLLSSDLQDDKEIVSVAMNQDPVAFRSASCRIKNTPLFASKAVEKFGWLLEECSEEGLKDDEKIVRLAVKTYPPAIQKASTRLQKQEGFIASLVRENAKVFQHATYFHDNEQIAKIADFQDRNLRQYASTRVQRLLKRQDPSWRCRVENCVTSAVQNTRWFLGV